jgi:hypothetical protein
MLEVIKITGDPNVPCQEYSFVIPDLNSPNAYICQEIEFQGSTAVEGYGQISPTGFRDPTWIPMEGFSLWIDVL